MQKIRLFSQYDSETLFNKVRRDIHDQVMQFPATNFLPDQFEAHRGAVKDKFRRQRPEIELANGHEALAERIFPKSQFYPGAKPDQQVRMNVLVYTYDFKGEVYLLGCQPTGSVPEPPGVWFVDPANRVLTLEYAGYEKSPRKVFTAHREYIPKMIERYEALMLEFDRFESELDGIISQAMQERQDNLATLNRFLSLVKQ